MKCIFCALILLAGIFTIFTFSISMYQLIFAECVVKERQRVLAQDGYQDKDICIKWMVK